MRHVTLRLDLGLWSAVDRWRVATGAASWPAAARAMLAWAAWYGLGQAVEGYELPGQTSELRRTGGESERPGSESE